MTIDLKLSKQSLAGIKALERGLQGLAKKEIQVGIVRAGNASAKKTVTFSKRTIAKAMGVPQKFIKTKKGQKRDIFPLLAKTSGPMPAMGAVIKVITKGRRLRAIKFAKQKTRRRKGRVQNAGVELKMWGQKRVIDNAFIAPVKYGGAGAEQTTEGVFKRSTDSRLPIEQIYGPGIAREAERHEGSIENFFKDEMKVQLPKHIDRAVASATRRKKR
tara:strand:- start:113 stop:760 length:648 start_codon:yes stop_codon:yes gene_type:complete